MPHIEFASVVNALILGLSIASIWLIAAIGLTIIYGTVGVINMAHGEFIMAGCYTAYVVQQIISSAGASLFISLVVGFIAVIPFTVLLQIGLYERVNGRTPSLPA